MREKNVIIVEDILDTGLTLSFLKKKFQSHQPASLRVAALLDKPSRRKQPFEADYVGFRFQTNLWWVMAWIMRRCTAIFPISASCPDSSDESSSHSSSMTPYVRHSQRDSRDDLCAIRQKTSLPETGKSETRLVSWKLCL